MRPEPIVIVGAGLAGWSVARELRKLAPQAPVQLVSADAADFYAKPGLSNACAQRRTPAQLVTTPAARMAASLQVGLHAHTRALAIDRDRRVLQTSAGPLPYGQLVLATGARPIRLPLAGDAAGQVLSVNHLDDFTVLHQRLTARPAGRVLILGAGLIGCEFANDLVLGGHAVSVADPGPRPLAALLPEAAGTRLRDALAALGVDWQLGRTVQAVDAAPDGTLRATLSDGRVLDGLAVVLSAVGLRPDTALAEAAGLACGRGIVVDARLRTSDPAIHALGDGAQYRVGPTDRPLPYVLPLLQAAKVLAAQLAGQEAPRLRLPVMPVAVKTPALPLVVAAPEPGTPGGWAAVSGSEGEWHWRDDAGTLRGFALAGAATPRRNSLAGQMAEA